MVNNAISFFERIRIPGRPVADPDSLVVLGNARFTLLTPRLIRLEWAADAKFEDRSTFAFPTRYAEAPAFSCEHQADGLTITTDYLTLHYRDDGRPFSPANLSILFHLNGQPVQWTPSANESGNLHGTRRTLDGCADAVLLENGLLSRDGWSVFDDSGSVVWDREQVWVEARSEEHQAGLVLLRLWARLQIAAARLHPLRRRDSAGAALCARPVVVALLGLQR